MSPAPLADYGTCNECGTPMRAARSYGSADPNTRPRKREGLCIPCYGTIRRGGAPQTEKTPKPSKPGSGGAATGASPSRATSPPRQDHHANHRLRIRHQTRHMVLAQQ
jgi:hypothetical protein